eukprot:TRINITY_DN11707_c0_g1_i5.p1 TRINITY_DN11707_c0_g1~~TRINITY_DN11707_c0_g1_i5.p1  ORF type:complete len:2690 (-),score=406.88 TRINITY_DN11707_c0_g1_i5:1272-9341(-)
MEQGRVSGGLTAESRIMKVFNEHWESFKSSSESEKREKFKKVTLYFVTSFKTTPILQNFGEIQEFATALVRMFGYEVDNTIGRQIPLNTTILRICSLSEDSLICISLKAMQLLVEEERFIHHLASEKVVGSVIKLLAYLYEKSMTSDSADIENGKVALDSFRPILSECCKVSSSLEDLVKGNLLANLFDILKGFTEPKTMGRFIQLEVFAILETLGSSALKKSIIDNLRRNTSLASVLTHIKSGSVEDPEILIGIWRVLILWVYKSSWTQSTFFDEFVEEDGFASFEEFVLRLDTCVASPDDLDSLFNIFLSLRSIGSRNLEPRSLASDPSTNGADIEDEKRVYLNSGTVIRQMEPVIVMKRIFCRAKSLEIQQKSIESLSPLYNASKYQYLVLQSLGQGIGDLLLPLDRVSVGIKRAVLSLLETAAIKYKVGLSGEFDQIRKVLEEKPGIDTLSALFVSMERILKSDPDYRGRLTGAGIFHLIMERVVEITGCLIKCLKQPNPSSPHQSYKLQSQGGDYPESMLDLDMGEMTHQDFETFGEIIVVFEDRSSFALTEAHLYINVLGILIEENYENRQSFKKRDLSKSLIQTAIFRPLRRSILNVFHKLISDDGESAGGHLGALSDLLVSSSRFDMFLCTDLLQFFASLVKKSKVKNLFSKTIKYPNLLAVIENIGSVSIGRSEKLIIVKNTLKLIQSSIEGHYQNFTLFDQQGRQGLGDAIIKSNLVDDEGMPQLSDLLMGLSCDSNTEPTVIRIPCFVLAFLEILSLRPENEIFTNLQKVLDIIRQHPQNSFSLSGALSVLLNRYKVGFCNESDRLHPLLMELLTELGMYRISSEEIRICLQWMSSSNLPLSFYRQFLRLTQISSVIPPFLYFEEKSSQNGRVHVPLSIEKGSLFANGLTFSMWFRVEKYEGQNKPITLVRFIFETKKASIQLQFNGGHLEYVTSSPETSRFQYLFQANAWYHIAIVHSRPKLQASTLNLFVNGVEQESQKMNFPGVLDSRVSFSMGSNQEKSLIDFVDSPTSKIAWFAGPSYLFDEGLAKDSIMDLYSLGPSYSYGFRGDLSVHRTLETLTTTGQRVQFLDTGSQLSNDKLLLGLSASHQAMSLVDGTSYSSGRVVLKNIAAASGQHGNIDIEGQVSLIWTQSIADIIRRIGGVSCFMSLIERSSSYEYMNILLEILATIIRLNAKNGMEMDRIGGYEILSSILKSKQQMIYPNTVKIIFSLGGYNMGLNPIIINSGAWKHLILNQSIWGQVNEHIQVSVFEKIIDYLSSADAYLYNIDEIKKLGILQFLFQCLRSERIQEKAFQKILKIIHLLLQNNPSKEDFKALVSFLASTLPQSPKRFNQQRGKGFFKLRKSSIDATSGFAEFQGSAKRPTQSSIRVRNKILELLLDYAKSYSQNPTVIPDFFQVFTPEVVFFFLSGLKADRTNVIVTKEQSRITFDETTAILVLRIFACQLSMNNSALFRQKIGKMFVSLSFLLSKFHQTAEIYMVLLSILFQKDVDIGSYFNAEYLISAFCPNRQEVSINYEEALQVILDMLKFHYSSTTNPNTIDFFTNPSHFGEGKPASPRATEPTSFRNLVSSKPDVGIPFFQFLKNAVVYSNAFLDVFKNPEVLERILDILCSFGDSYLNSLPKSRTANAVSPEMRTVTMLEVSSHEYDSPGRKVEADFFTPDEWSIIPEVSQEVNQSRVLDHCVCQSIFELLRNLTTTSIKTMSKGYTIFESILDFVPDGANTQLLFSFQSRIITDIMSYINQQYINENFRSFDLKILVPNLTRICSLLVDKVSQGWFDFSEMMVLHFVINVVRKVTVISSFSKFPFMGSLKADTNVQIIFRAFNRIILIHFHQMMQKNESQYLPFLEVLRINSGTVFASNNQDGEFFACMLYHIIRIFEKYHHMTELIEMANELFKDLIKHKRGLIQEHIFPKLPQLRLETQLTQHAHKLFDTYNQADLKTWLIGRKPENNTVVQNYLRQSWNGFKEKEARGHSDYQTSFSERKRIRKQKTTAKTSHARWVRAKFEMEYLKCLHDLQLLEAKRETKRTWSMKDRDARIRCTWKLILQDLSHRKGIFDSSADSERWALDGTEASNRMRRRMKPTKDRLEEYFNFHAKAEMYSQFYAEEERKKKEKEVLSAIPESTYLADYEQGLAEKDDPDESEDEEEFESVEEVATENPDAVESEDVYKDVVDEKGGALMLIQTGDAIQHVTFCSQVSLMDKSDGTLVVGDINLYFMQGYRVTMEGEIASMTQEEDFVGVFDDRIQIGEQSVKPTNREVFTWPYESIKDIHIRRYLLQQVAIELFCRDGRNYFLVFMTPQDRDTIYSKLLSKISGGSVIEPKFTQGLSVFQSDEWEDTPKISLWKKSMTQRWQQGEISNFQYLMYLNTLAGRTYNDLTQYPVFPWILQDYTSETLDFQNPKIYRDLSKPMGAITEKRANDFRSRFENWEEVDGIPKFHYGTHYSSAGIVLYYLIRLEPFTHHHVELQSGRFDHPDRLFHSLRETWLSATEYTLSDVKELIPEFYYLPEAFVNTNQYDFGIRQDNEKIQGVVLPPWSKGDVLDFIKKHRQALESDYVSERLNDWIDLIFGYKQQGKAAEEAINVFYYLTYEGKIDIDAITDPTEKKAKITQINNFGQTPKQLFKKPHPKRLVLPKHIPTFPNPKQLVVWELKSPSIKVGNISLNGEKPLYFPTNKV